MIIALSTPTFDLAGHVVINPLPGTGDSEIRRRVSRVATLDGGAAINDRGFSDGDRDLVYTWKSVSREHNDQVARLVALYARVHVATPSGFFLAAPESFTPGSRESSIRLLVIRKLSV